MNRTKDLIIVGTGLFAEVAYAYFKEYSQYEVKAFACHAQYRDSETKFGLDLISIEEMTELFSPQTYEVFVAIGYGNMNKMRARVYHEMKEYGYSCVNFIHPQVKIWENTSLGDNVFIFENNTIQPFTKIGNNTIMWSGNHLGHHSVVGNHCFISSHVVISGSCKIGNNVFIGVNATLRDSISIANESLIGAAAIVMNDTQEKEVLIAPKTKPFPKNSEELGF